MEKDHRDCDICYSLIILPVKLKCQHLFCLTCIQKLISDGNHKCPLDRKEFDYENDIIFEESVMEKNYKENNEEFIEKAKNLLNLNMMNSKMKEIQILYGNTHELINTSSNNRNRWICYVKINKNQGKITDALNKLQAEEKLCKILGIKKFNSEEQKSKSTDLILSDSDMIKSVTFCLHPTFNPPSVKVTDEPFQINRIGWGVFEIEIKIEFHKKFKLENLKLNHFLSFNENDSFITKTIYLDSENIN